MTACKGTIYFFINTSLLKFVGSLLLLLTTYSYGLGQKDSIVHSFSNIYLSGISDSTDKTLLSDEFVEISKTLQKKIESQELINFGIRLSGSLKNLGYCSNAINVLEATRSMVLADTHKVVVRREMFYLYNALGVLYITLHDAKNASSNYLQALYFAEKSNCDSCLASITNNLGEFYLSQREYSKTIDLIKRAVAINEKLQSKRNLQINYTNLGVVYYEQKEYQKAEKFYQKALSNIDSTDIQSHAILLLNTSLIYRDNKEYSKAEGYLYGALKLLRNTPDNIVSHKAYLLLAKLYAEQKNRNKALEYCTKALTLNNRINRPGKRAETFRTLTDVYMLLGDSALALNYMLQYENINDSLIEADNKETLNRLLSVYEVKLLQQQKHELEQLNKINKLTVSRQKIVIGSIIFIVILLIWLLLLISQKFRSDKEKSLLLHEQKELLLKHEKQNLLQEHEKMEQEIDFKNRQLTIQTLNQVANNEFRIVVNKSLSAIKKEIKANNTTQAVTQINKLSNEIKHVSDNYLSEEFTVYFDSVHPSFNENLQKKFPELTVNDMRLCAFLKMGLSTKEIASLTFREVRSVESARNRLRKKLNLPAEVNLQSYLSDM